MNVFINLDEGAKIPTKGSALAAGYDIYSNQDITIPVGERKLVSTGFRLDISGYVEHTKHIECNHHQFKDYITKEYIPVYFRIAPRSGLACKGIDVGAGVVDSDYHMEVKILLINNSKTDFEVKKGDRIAQGIFERIVDVVFNQVDEIEENGRGGFGSTGTR